jgi:peptide/nickel transport system permease protein
MTMPWRTRLALAWLLIIGGAAMLAPVLSTRPPRDPSAASLLKPSSEHPLGTDPLGRDVWSRLIHGGRLSLGIPLLALTLTLGVGGLAGIVAVVGGPILDRLILWGANALLSIPGLLLAMLLLAGLGPGIWTVVLAVGLAGAPGFARLSRSVLLLIRSQNYVEAAVALGGGPAWIAWAHLLPNAASQLASLAATHYAWSFLGTTTLTFLGLGGDPSLAEWGAMLNAGRSYLVETPRLALLPGGLITLTILAAQTLGDWLGNSPRPPRPV